MWRLWIPFRNENEEGTACRHFAIVTLCDGDGDDNVNDGSLTIQFFSVCHLPNDLSFHLCSVDWQPIDMMCWMLFMCKNSFADFHIRMHIDTRKYLHMNLHDIHKTHKWKCVNLAHKSKWTANEWICFGSWMCVNEKCYENWCDFLSDFPSRRSLNLQSKWIKS